MKFYLLIGAVLVILVSIGIFILWPSTTPATDTSSAGTFPSSNTVTDVSGGGSTTTDIGNNTTMTIPSQITDNEVVTKDFIHNGSTVSDVQNPDRYFLAGNVGYCLPDGSCPSGAPSDEYNVVFQKKDSVFLIALLKEPLSLGRQHAEQFLRSALGISEIEMCTLKYYISTDSYTNSVYAGKNLLFSFCKGATPLPQ